MDDSWFRENAGTEEGKLLLHCLDFAEYFSDMLFEKGSSTYELVKCQTKSSDGEWIDEMVPLPEIFQYFSYTYFKVRIESANNKYGGYFDQKNQLICITSNNVNDDSVLLHELIHLHEYVINMQPMFYHDAVFWKLYCNLKEKINDLDEVISRHANILSGQLIYNEGGNHDILFFLKSLDLDMKMGYRLGTVFGYQMDKSLQNLGYVFSE